MQQIKLFFKDYFGDNYETAVVKDMFGVKHNVKDIELITTIAVVTVHLDRSPSFQIDCIVS